jgi:hypothetical protein
LDSELSAAAPAAADDTAAFWSSLDYNWWWHSSELRLLLPLLDVCTCSWRIWRKSETNLLSFELDSSEANLKPT